MEDTQSCDSFKKLRKANDNKFWTSIFEEFGLVLHDFGDLESVKPKRIKEFRFALVASKTPSQEPSV